jgi:hypothetical protein
MSNTIDMSMIGTENWEDSEPNDKVADFDNKLDNSTDKQYWEETSIVDDNNNDNECGNVGEWKTIEKKSKTLGKGKPDYNSLYGKKNDLKHAWTDEEVPSIKKAHDGLKYQRKMSNVELYKFKLKEYKLLKNK